MFKNIKLKKALMCASLGLLGVGAVVGSTVVYNNYVEQNAISVNDSDITVDGEDVDDGSILDYMPGNICFRKNAIKNSTVRFTATVLPENATNKTITWSLGWSSTGVVGNANDYVGLSVSADTHTVTLTCKKGFNNQIKLTGTTVDGVSTSATIDMLKYVSAMTIKTDQGDVNISLDDNTDKILSTTHKYDISGMFTGSWSSNLFFDTYTYTTTGTVGSISPQSAKLGPVCNLYLTSSFKDYCNSNGIVPNDAADTIYTSYTGPDCYLEYAIDDCFVLCDCGPELSQLSKGEWLSKITSYSENQLYTWTEFTTTYNSISNKQKIGYSFGVTGSYVDTTGISLSSSSVILQ